MRIGRGTFGIVSVPPRLAAPRGTTFPITLLKRFKEAHY
jgi:hypothetical protein